MARKSVNLQGNFFHIIIYYEQCCYFLRVDFCVTHFLNVVEAPGSAGETGTCRADWREGWRDWSDWSSGHPVFSSNWKGLLWTEWFPGYEVHGSDQSVLHECPCLQERCPASLPLELLQGPLGSFQATQGLAAGFHGVGKFPARYVICVP